MQGGTSPKSRWPIYEDDEIAAVTAVLRSGQVNSLHHGEQCQALEQGFAQLCGMPHGIALANGTLALELALRALGIGAGDEVLVPARSFFASVSCVVAVGAHPVFVDIDLASGNMDPQAVRDAIGPNTRAVLCVHLAGWPCEMGKLRALCDEHGLLLVEDCAQAHGATYNGRVVGSFGDAAAFSFCTDKIISTGGEGGLLLLRDPDAFERAWSYKDHGKDRARTFAPAGGSQFRWLHTSFGSNWRLTEMQAAIGNAQLAKLPGWLAARRRNAAILDRALEGVPGVIVDRPAEHIGHARYKYYARIDTDMHREPGARDAIASAIAARGPFCGSGSCPEMYLEDAIRGSLFAPASRLPNAQELGASSLMFQCDQTLSAEQMAEIGAIAADVIGNWGRAQAAA